MKPLTRSRIAEIEKHWHQYGSLPKMTPDELEDQELRHALTQRGINMGKELTEEQVAAILTITNFEDRRSRQRKLKDLDITLVKWNGWKRNPTFKAYLESISNDELRSSIHVAHEGLIKAMDRGQTEAIKFYMEQTGRNEAPELQNMRLVLSRLVESIQMHVRDPAILARIAADFEEITKGAAAGPVHEPTPMTIANSI